MVVEMFCIHGLKTPILFYILLSLGVYTKNRNFRLYMSSKAGHIVILNIAEDNKFVPKPVNNSCIDEQYFLSSLICNVR